MPIMGSTAYLTVESVTNLIRAVINDMIYSQAGEIFTDTANFTFVLLNDSLEWFQNEVNNHGIDTFTKETFLTDILPIAVNDPGIQVSISDSGYFDGVQNHAMPQLPTDMLQPIRLWERQTGSTEEWVPMRMCPDGLPSVVQSQRLCLWDYYDDAIYMPGATQENDIRFRYKGSHALLATPNDTLYFRGATGPIAYKTISTFLASRNPKASMQAGQEATRRCAQLFTRNSRMKQHRTITRRGYGSQIRGGRYWPPQNP